MHCGNIRRMTAAGRVYRLLKENQGRWLDALFIAQEAMTTCLSTRIAEVRSQLDGRTIEHKEQMVNGRRRQYYRLMEG